MSTKMIALAAALLASTATVASANNSFPAGLTLERGDVLELGTIAVDGNGVVEIYDYFTGQQGELLAIEALNPGANADVRLTTGLPVTKDVLAVLKVDGQIVDTQHYTVQ